MKNILVILLLLLFVGCVQPVLPPKDYIIVDTINTNRNAFTRILSYDVVIKIKEDSSLHYGVITPDGMLVDITFKKIKNYYK